MCSNWGDVVEWGSRHKKNTAEECCRACQSHKKTSEDALDCNGTTFHLSGGSVTNFSSRKAVQEVPRTEVD